MTTVVSRSPLRAAVSATARALLTIFETSEPLPPGRHVADPIIMKNACGLREAGAVTGCRKGLPVEGLTMKKVSMPRSSLPSTRGGFSGGE